MIQRSLSGAGCAVGSGAGEDCVDQHEDGQGFLIVERRSRWCMAIELPGLEALNSGGTVPPDREGRLILVRPPRGLIGGAHGGWLRAITSDRL